MPEDRTPSTALIPLASATVEGAEVQTVDARELHAFLGAGRDFNTWIKDRVVTYGFAEGTDYVTTEGLISPVSGSSKARRRRTVDFHLTLDMAKELAMVERRPRGREARRYFIACERRAHALDPLAALSDPTALRALLLKGTERELSLKADVAELAPKAEALDRLATADGSFTRTDASKVLQVSRKALIAHMRARRWTYQRAGSGDEVGYQDKVAAGLLEHKTTTVQGRGGSERVCVQVRVTSKGLARLGREMVAA